MLMLYRVFDSLSGGMKCMPDVAVRNFDATFLSELSDVFITDFCDSVPLDQLESPIVNSYTHRLSSTALCLSSSLCLCTSIYMSVCRYVCICVYVGACVCVCLCVDVSMPVCVPVCLRMGVCVC